MDAPASGGLASAKNELTSDAWSWTVIDSCSDITAPVSTFRDASSP